MVERLQQVAVETTYWPGTLGAYLWHEFDARVVDNDLKTVRALGFRTVRVHLGWDAFMPTHRQVAASRLRDFDAFLGLAADAGLRVVPVLFAQSFGDSVMLPLFAIDSTAPRRGVRVVCDGRVQIGGPRDLYSDPLMLESAVLWLDTMLSAFANHPAIGGWDLGHDPATTVRPIHTRDFTGWVAEMAGRVRARGDACRLTAGVGDLLTARAVRLHELAPHLDRLDIAVMPQRLGFGRGWPDVSDLVFLTQLAQRLAGDVNLGVQICVASGESGIAALSPRDPGIAAADDAAAYAARVVPALGEVGVVAVSVWPSHTLAQRAAESAPVDRWPSLASAGLINASGGVTEWGAAWSRHAKAEWAALPTSPWPEILDTADYYAHLPDAAKELFTSWRSGEEEHPGIVF